MSGSGAPAVLGIDLGGTKIAVAVSDTDGTVFDTVSVPTDAAAGADAVVILTCATAASLLGRHARRAVAVGAVTPGVPTPDRIHLAPNIPGWGGVSLGPRLREGLASALAPGAPVVIDNDVKAGAAYEARSGALAGSATGLYLNLGTGISSAVVVDGRVLRGAHGAAGEIAYQVPTPADLADADPRADRAPLEELVGGRALDAVVARGRPSALRAGQALAGDDETLHGALEPALAALDATVVNLCCLLDPDTVVLAGGLLHAADVLVARLRRAVRAAVPFPPDVRPAARPFDAPLYGAVLLAASALGDATDSAIPPASTGSGLEESA